jgi:hypothetical protein
MVITPCSIDSHFTNTNQQNIFPYKFIQGDQNISVHLMITVQKTCKNILNITKHIRNLDSAILDTLFENTVRRVNKCLKTGGGHIEHYM